MPPARIAFADTNWLVSTYHETRDSRWVKEWARPGRSTIIVSEAVMAECQCNFWRLGNQWSRLQADAQSGLWIDCGQSFENLAALAADLFRKFAPRCNVGTLDLLHVAAARNFGCSWFLSFDVKSGCRAVANACGLKVFPPLQPEDREWRAKFAGR